MQKPPVDRTTKIREVEARLEALAGERNQLVAELAELRSSAPANSELLPLLGLPASPRTPESSEEKVALFLKLFRARESVFPKLWENSTKGTKGYSPACNNEWVRGVCGKPQVKCSECPNQAFPKLDEQPVRDHLQGKFTIGTYVFFHPERCRDF